MDIPNVQDDKIALELIKWCERNGSIIVTTPTGRFYGLFYEPDGEGPRMQFMGSSPVRAFAFVKAHSTNRYS